MSEQFASLPFPLQISFADGAVSGAVAGAIPLYDSRLSDFVNREGEIFLGNLSVGKGKLNEARQLEILSFGMAGISMEDFLSGGRMAGCLLEVRLVISRSRITLRDYASLAPGSIIKSDQPAAYPLDLLLGSVLIARCEAVVIGEALGARVCESLSKSEWERRAPRDNTSREPEIHYEAVLGARRMIPQEILGLGEGSILAFDECIREPCRLHFENGAEFLADVVVVDENFGFRILKGTAGPGGKLIPDDGLHASGFSLRNSGKDKISHQILSERIDSLEKKMNEIKRNSVSPHSDQRQGGFVPFEGLKRCGPDKIAKIICFEHPQVIAMILASLDSAQASMILQALPYQLQSDVLERVARLDKISADVLRAASKILEEKLDLYDEKEFLATGGIDAASKILMDANLGMRVSILDLIEERDPLLADEIRQRVEGDDNEQTNPQIS